MKPISGPNQKSKVTCPEYPPMELALDELYEARARWERRDYMTTARVMAEVGIDSALDLFNELRSQDG